MGVEQSQALRLVARISALTDRLDLGDDFKTPSQGAATGLWAATSPLLDGRGGLYLEDCDIARVSTPDQPMDDGGVRAYAIDPDEAARLWDLSVAATGARPILP